MSTWPFPEEAQLSDALEPNNKNSEDGQSLNNHFINQILQYLPSEPTVSLQPHILTAYLSKELLTPDLNQMRPYLWLVGTQDSNHITPLHEQLVKGRSIFITERAELHCTWIYDRVFLKPIPAYLLSWRFWQHFLVSENSAIPSVERKAVCGAALGFLRTYSCLLRHESDFRIAVSNYLIPGSMT